MTSSDAVIFTNLISKAMYGDYMYSNLSDDVGNAHANDY